METIDFSKILFDPAVLEQICENLTLSEILNLRKAVGPTLPTCRYPIFDVDELIRFLPVDDQTEELMYEISEIGSATTFFQSVEKGRFDLVKSLLDSGMNPNLTDRGKFSPLLLAARIPNPGSLETIKLLLDRGADINHQEGLGRMALIFAIDHRNLEVVRELLKRGANVNIKDSYGNTPLRAAVRLNQPEIVKLLLEAGADVRAVTVNGGTILQAAIWHQNPKIIDLLTSYGAQ